MISKWHYPLFVLLGAVLLLSCASRPRGPYSPITREDGKPPHQLSHGVTMMDMNVRNSFLLIKHSARKTIDGHIQVSVTMQNAFGDTHLWADVRFVFFNTNDEPIEQTQWRTVHFPPWSLVLVDSNSLRNDAVKFNAQFRNLYSKTGRKLTFPGKVYEHGYWRGSILPE